MNLPNKLTLLRALMVPVFVFFMLFPTENVVLFRILACAVFCVASFTDFLDGYIARKEHLVTNFGKFMDPLADKLLVCLDLYGSFILLTGVVCHCPYRKRICDFRFPSDCGGTECRDCCFLLWKV